MAEYINLTKAQKEELRRLYQFANRRIKNAFNAYEKAGKEIVPTELVGHIQTREDWQTEKYALSRTVKFATHQEYRKQLQFLRSFETRRDGIKEFTRVQRDKIISAVSTATGERASRTLEKKLNKMSAPQLADFWNSFSDRASKMGVQYSSDAVMRQTIAEFFEEDFTNLVERSIPTNIMQRARSNAKVRKRTS